MKLLGAVAGRSRCQEALQSSRASLTFDTSRLLPSTCVVALGEPCWIAARPTLGNETSGY